MCRSIKVLRKADYVPTTDEVNAAALQFVKKISGFQKPSRANKQAFDQAVSDVAAASAHLLRSLGTKMETPALIEELGAVENSERSR